MKVAAMSDNQPNHAAAAGKPDSDDVPDEEKKMSAAPASSMVGYDDLKKEDICELSQKQSLDYTGKPRPKVLIRKWPSELMYRIGSNQDDEWPEVMERINSHPNEILIQGRNGGMNALHAACVRYPPLHVVEEMVKKHPEAVSSQNYNGETPLHIASYSASEEVQAVLVNAAPEAAGIKDQYGDYPLHFAARAGATYALMEKFVSADPSVISRPNLRGITPFWLLPRTYLECEDIEEILDVEGENYRDDWDSLALFLKYSYSVKGNDFPVRDEDGTPLPVEKEQYNWIVHAAASTSSCPREVLRFLCRLFPDQALVRNGNGFTPLLLAVQQKETREPANWSELEDGFREEVDAIEGEIQIETDVLQEEEAQMQAGNAQFIEQVFCDQNSESVDAAQPPPVQILLEWSPRSALEPDSADRLPLTHALLSGLSWGSVKKLIAACPRALEVKDPVTCLYNFQLAAVGSPQLDTVYSLVRSLPELLICEIRRPDFNDMGEPREPPEKRQRIK